MNKNSGDLNNPDRWTGLRKEIWVLPNNLSSFAIRNVQRINVICLSAAILFLGTPSGLPVRSILAKNLNHLYICTAISIIMSTAHPMHFLLIRVTSPPSNFSFYPKTVSEWITCLDLDLLLKIRNRNGTEDGLLSDSNSCMLKWSIVQNKEKSSYLFSKRSFHRGFVIFLFKTSQLRMLSSVSNVTSLQDRLCNCQSGKNYCQIKIGKTCNVKSVSFVKNVKIVHNCKTNKKIKKI